MAEVFFYHLTRSTLEETLPGLVVRSLDRGWRAVVQSATEERRDALDAHLWTWNDESFVAHGCDHDPHAAEQPVLLTTGSGNANDAQIRFIVEGAEPPDLAPYERVAILFDGHDAEQLARARAQWKVLKSAGHDLVYWQQTEDGRWEKAA